MADEYEEEFLNSPIPESDSETLEDDMYEGSLDYDPAEFGEVPEGDIVEP
jgi:hypothetical protein